MKQAVSVVCPAEGRVSGGGGGGEESRSGSLGGGEARRSPLHSFSALVDRLTPDHELPDEVRIVVPHFYEVNVFYFRSSFSNGFFIVFEEFRRKFVERIQRFSKGLQHQLLALYVDNLVSSAKQQYSLNSIQHKNQIAFISSWPFQAFSTDLL